MNVRIAHSRISESGTIDGVAGDQTGHEVEITKLTDRDWFAVYRCSDLDKRDVIARTAEDGAKNCHVGYSQKTRLTLFEAAKKVGYNLMKITKDCNCDCSSFVAVCVIASGVHVSPDMYTGNMTQTLTGTGLFIRLPFDSKSLIRGDIILCTGHTAIVTEGRCIIEDTEIKTPVYAASFDRDRAGVYEAETAVYLREGNGISYTAYTVIPSGGRVRCYGYYSAGIDSQRKGTDWLLVDYDAPTCCRYTGFVCEKWLKRVKT